MTKKPNKMWWKTGIWPKIANSQRKKNQIFELICYNFTIFYVTSTVCLTHFNHYLLSLRMLSVEWRENIFRKKMNIIILLAWTTQCTKNNGTNYWHYWNWNWCPHRAFIRRSIRINEQRILDILSCNWTELSAASN